MTTTTKTFGSILIDALSPLHLLKHPYYQAWSDGCLSRNDLCKYATQYYQHVKAFPRYLSATHSHCKSIEDRQFLLENLMDEERGSENHPELWLRFVESLGATRGDAVSGEALPFTEKLVSTFFHRARNSYAEGLGVLFAYEHQIPEIAAFKMEALQQFYEVRDERSLSFFEVHKKADIYHTETLKALLEKLSPSEKALALEAAQDASEVLWKFLDGMQGLRKLEAVS